MKKIAFILSLLFFTSQNIALAGTISFDQLAVSSDLTVAKYNADLDRVYQKLNSNVQTDNIADDTLTEPDFADEINPRIRTNETAACPDLVYEGLLPTTTSGTLVGSIPAGTVYPDGYRINKSSATPKTFTASKWTWGYIDISGNFSYQEQTIGGSTPSQPANTAILFRASTDGTQVIDVQDLRRTSCANGPFSAIADASNQATLSDLFSKGQPVRRFSPAGRTPAGFAQGAYVSWDTATTFKVTSGSLYINGKYRSVSQDLTITQAADDPTNGGSGVDTTIANSTTYYVYAVADQDDVKTFSVTISANASAPAGVTNYRLIGQIKTDATTLYTSRDIVTVHATSERETIGAWVKYTTVGTTQILDSYNVSGLVDDAAGVTTISWDSDFNNVSYDVVCMTGPVRGYCHIGSDARVGSAQIVTTDNNGASSLDQAQVMVIAIGDRR